MKSIFLKSAANLLVILLLYPLAGGKDIKPLQQAAVVLEKPQVIVSEATIEYLGKQADGQVKIWVFFNDKGIADEAEFRLAAGRIEINEHARKRRAKVSMEGIVFADLPVKQEYIEQIAERGARLRRISRWLNAASFEIERELVPQIADLPFVNKISPVAGYKRIELEDTGIDTERPKFIPAEPDALNYGQSWTQVNMINIPAMHEMGYKGEGIIVAILDTGYRKTHQAFSQAVSEGRILAEYDFIFNDEETQNEAEDNWYQHFHGTYCWSTLGGYSSGNVIGPAYGASFLLAKTEDVRSESQVEEDNWVAALEWADSLGVDVISTSLGYSAWYTYEDMNGSTATTTLAANTAMGLGIVVCNSMGNAGPSPGTLSAPADAHDILACGAVHLNKIIADFSSKGPTYDGRTKPEVCAMGVNTRCADASSDNVYTNKSGTSLSTPLIGGTVAVLLSANPYLTPHLVRMALMETADNAETPDNTYGWGVIDALQAFNWGANFTADVTFGVKSLTVHFTDSSSPPPSNNWKWYFGDGDSAAVQNPTHTYTQPGSYDVTLIIYTHSMLRRTKEDFIAVIADTLFFESTTASSKGAAVMSVNLTNTQKLNSIIIPVTYESPLDIVLTQVTLGTRTVDFESISEIYRNDEAKELVFEMIADGGTGTPLLQPGSGEIARLYFTIYPPAYDGQTAVVDASEIVGYQVELSNRQVEYGPVVVSGEVVVESGTVLRGDADGSGDINLLDITYLIDYLYKGGPPPVTFEAGDADANGLINLLDITYLINYLYSGGPPPPPKN